MLFPYSQTAGSLVVVVGRPVVVVVVVVVAVVVVVVVVVVVGVDVDVAVLFCAKTALEH